MRISDWSSDVCFFRSTSVTERVRRLLEQDPGRSSSRDIAALLDVSTSTMKRRLEDEGTTFRQVRQSLLRERAIVLLLDHSLTNSQIAVDLGYGDPGNFTHAFKRWTGQSPSEFRNVGRLGEGGSAVDRKRVGEGKSVSGRAVH